MSDRHPGRPEKRKRTKRRDLWKRKNGAVSPQPFPEKPMRQRRGRPGPETRRPYAVVTRVHGGGPGAPTAHTTIWIHGARVFSSSVNYTGKTPGTVSQPPRKCPDRSASGTDHPRKPLPQPHPRDELRRDPGCGDLPESLRPTSCHIYQPIKSMRRAERREKKTQHKRKPDKENTHTISTPAHLTPEAGGRDGRRSALEYHPCGYGFSRHTLPS